MVRWKAAFVVVILYWVSGVIDGASTPGEGERPKEAERTPSPANLGLKRR